MGGVALSCWPWGFWLGIQPSSYVPIFIGICFISVYLSRFVCCALSALPIYTYVLGGRPSCKIPYVLWMLHCGIGWILRKGVCGDISQGQY